MTMLIIQKVSLEDLKLNRIYWNQKNRVFKKNLELDGDLELIPYSQVLLFHTPWKH